MEGFLPQIYHRAPQLAPKKRQIKLPKEADLLSKLSPVQQAQKAFLEDLEAHLTPHPLALYPNLEEAMPVEVMCPRVCGRGFTGALQIILFKCLGSPHERVTYIYKRSNECLPQGTSSCGPQSSLLSSAPRKHNQQQHAHCSLCFL